MSIEHLDGLSLKDLRCIAAVARHRSFGRAAEALHMAQPSVSASIAKAESLLQRRLFERTGRSFCVTTAGNQVLEVIVDAYGRQNRVQIARNTGLSEGEIETATADLLQIKVV